MNFFDDCLSRDLCITVYLHGFWTGSQHSCDATVTIELYDGAKSYVDSFIDVSLSADGQAIVDLAAEGVSSGVYYIVARHFNHLDLATAEMVSLSLTGPNPWVDFSDPDQVDHGEDALFLSNGEWTMPVGDANEDGRVNLGDCYLLLINWNGTATECDFDCDGKCRLSDYFFLLQTWNMRSYAPEP